MSPSIRSLFFTGRLGFFGGEEFLTIGCDVLVQMPGTKISMRIGKNISQCAKQCTVPIGDEDLWDPLGSPNMLLQISDCPKVTCSVFVGQKAKGYWKRSIGHGLTNDL
jgi:hypothetical protein